MQRLNYLWTEANNQSRSGNLKGWRWTLDTIWRELSRDAVHQEKGFTPEKFDDIKKNHWVKGYEQRIKAIDKANQKQGKEQLVVLYRSLHDLEVFLRILQDKVGKGGKYRDPTDDDM